MVVRLVCHWRQWGLHKVQRVMLLHLMFIHNHMGIKWHQTVQKLGTCTYSRCSESINPCCHRFWVTVVITWTMGILSLVNFKFNCSVCPLFWKMYLHASTLDLQFWSWWICMNIDIWIFFYFSFSMHEDFMVIYTPKRGSQLWTWTTIEPIDVKVVIVELSQSLVSYNSWGGAW